MPAVMYNAKLIIFLQAGNIESDIAFNQSDVCISWTCEFYISPQPLPEHFIPPKTNYKEFI